MVSKRQWGISPREGPTRTRVPFTKSWYRLSAEVWTTNESGAVSSVTEWACDERRFGARWIAAVEGALDGFEPPYWLDDVLEGCADADQLLLVSTVPGVSASLVPPSSA